MSQLDKAHKRVARMVGDVENMACGRVFRDGAVCPRKAKAWMGAR